MLNDDSKIVIDGSPSSSKSMHNHKMVKIRSFCYLDLFAINFKIHYPRTKLPFPDGQYGCLQHFYQGQYNVEQNELNNNNCEYFYRDLGDIEAAISVTANATKRVFVICGMQGQLAMETGQRASASGSLQYLCGECYDAWKVEEIKVIQEKAEQMKAELGRKRKLKLIQQEKFKQAIKKDQMVQQEVLREMEFNYRITHFLDLADPHYIHTVTCRPVLEEYEEEEEQQEIDPTKKAKSMHMSDSDETQDSDLEAKTNLIPDDVSITTYASVSSSCSVAGALGELQFKEDQGQPQVLQEILQETKPAKVLQESFKHPYDICVNDKIIPIFQLCAGRMLNFIEVLQFNNFTLYSDGKEDSWSEIGSLCFSRYLGGCATLPF